MSKIAALQLETLHGSLSRLDFYLKACKDSGAGAVVLGEYVLNSFFTTLCKMKKSEIKAQSVARKAALKEFALKYELEIIAPFVEVGTKGFKKVCLKISPTETKSYEQQILMPYEHWNEAKFFANAAKNLRLFCFDYDELKCALLFGFEAHFDAFWTQILAKKLDLVIIPTAATFESKFRWQELLKTRAFLNSTAILRVNRIGNEGWEFYGDTLFINAYGELCETLSDKEEMLIVDVKKSDDARKLWGFEKIMGKFKQ